MTGILKAWEGTSQQSPLPNPGCSWRGESSNRVSTPPPSPAFVCFIPNSRPAPSSRYATASHGHSAGCVVSWRETMTDKNSKQSLNRWLDGIHALLSSGVEFKANVLSKGISLFVPPPPPLLSVSICFNNWWCFCHKRAAMSRCALVKGSVLLCCEKLRNKSSAADVLTEVLNTSTSWPLLSPSTRRQHACWVEVCYYTANDSVLFKTH